MASLKGTRSLRTARAVLDAVGLRRRRGSAPEREGRSCVKRQAIPNVWRSRRAHPGGAAALSRAVT
eukprot:2635012-Pleurochrysis_carterae.AAC.1